MVGKKSTNTVSLHSRNLAPILPGRATADSLLVEGAKWATTEEEFVAILFDRFFSPSQEKDLARSVVATGELAVAIGTKTLNHEASAIPWLEGYNKLYDVEVTIGDAQSDIQAVMFRMPEFVFRHTEISWPSSMFPVIVLWRNKKEEIVFGRVSTATNACQIKTKYFTTKLEVSLNHKPTGFIYAPTGTERERREVKGFFMDRSTRKYTPIEGLEPERESEKDFLDKSQPQKKILKRIYRTADEQLADPTQDPRAEVNRLKQKVGIRIDPTLIEKMKRAAAKEGITQTDWLERAIKKDLKQPPEP